MVKDTVIVISRRVSYDTLPPLVELKPLKAKEIPIALNYSIDTTLPELPSENAYFCEQKDEPIMHTSTLNEVVIKAYPLDGYFKEGAFIALIIFTIWYLAGSINRWKNLYDDLKNCRV